MKSRTIGTALAVAAVFLMAGCSSGQPGNVASTAAAPSTPGCRAQVQAWSSQGGGHDMRAVSRDGTKISRANRATAQALNGASGISAALSALATASSHLGADAQTARSDSPPACVPGMAAAYRAGMAQYGKSSRAALNAISQMRSGNYSAGASAMKASTTAINKGTKDIIRATAALNAFISPGGGPGTTSPSPSPTHHKARHPHHHHHVVIPAPSTAPAPASGAQCTATASVYNASENENNVYVHSNQPYTEATASADGHSWSYETDGSGYALIYLNGPPPGALITVTVGGATCTTSD
jgi:hypothetical protein